LDRQDRGAKPSRPGRRYEQRLLGVDCPMSTGPDRPAWSRRRTSGPGEPPHPRVALPLVPGSHFVPDIVGDRRRGFAGAGAEGLLSVGCGQRRTPDGQVLGALVPSLSGGLVAL